MQEDSLGTEYQYRFLELLQEFNPKSVFLSVHHSWKGGIHIQSCGHHMHFDCRQSYCETLKQQMRVTRDQALDTDQGDFICPVCRQMANGLLPVPPPPALVPANSLVSVASPPAENRRRIASKIHQLLGEETVHLVSERFPSLPPFSHLSRGHEPQLSEPSGLIAISILIWPETKYIKLIRHIIAKY